MLSLSVLPNSLAISRLSPSLPIPSWAIESEFFSITKTGEELSIVCPEEKVPENVRSERGWRALKVEGPLDFSLTGILSSLLKPLADAEVSIFALSTYDTDYLLVKKENLDRTIEILSRFCKIF